MESKDKLNFPVIKEALPEARVLSMDEYLEFVLFNLKYTVDIEAAREQKKAFFNNAPFVLK